MTATRYKPQLWKRILTGTELGDIEQFIRHTEDGQWLGWMVYSDGHSTDPLPVSGKIIPLGYHEIIER
jgi:hypothetical protein